MKLNELIEKYKRYEGKWNNKTGELARQIFLEDLKQLDEPEKVKIPEFMAEKIDYFKKTGDWDLFQAMDSLFGRKETMEWLEGKNNQELFALAWIFGYEVEKEKRYRISMPKARNYMNHAQFLCEKDGKIFWCGEWYPFKTKFTCKQLEDAGFGWVFDCEGVEVEEVKDEHTGTN